VMSTCRCAGWACRVVCVCARARVCGVMVAGIAALVGMCVRRALGLGKCEASWLRHARDVRCASGVNCRRCFERSDCRSIAIPDLCCRVRVAAPRLAVTDV
jgi:hypothetical protein